MARYIYTLIITLILIACDGGLKPMPEPSLSGTVYFEKDSPWPPADSLKDLRVVAFRTFPLPDSSGIVELLFSGQAVFSEPLTYYTDSSDFYIELSKIPDTLRYIAVAQQYGTLLEWKAVGVYSLSGDNTKNSQVIIKEPIDYKIKINVDFNNLPPQPF